MPARRVFWLRLYDQILEAGILLTTSYENFLMKHCTDNEWIDNEAFVFAAYVFNMRIYLYNRNQNYWNARFLPDPQLRANAQFQNDTLANLPESDEAMYIDFVNENHFEVAHNGIELH